ncbi:2OG-Fe dioxygenase family protein [Polycladospora coralii]|uniref:2OG-Fe dioxygenase family protein n=1 Tax=Polycladospora coralii TaxID=2771432 RepID=UPI00322028AB
MKTIALSNNSLQANGYATYDLFKELSHVNTENNIAELKSEFHTLPIDDYAKNCNRYRKYSRAVIFPNSLHIEWLPNYQVDGEQKSEYYQGAFNSEYTGDYRSFHPLSDSIKLNPLLNEIIRFDFQQTFWNDRDLILPVHAGIHFVKLLVNQPDEYAVASPNHLHQDGESFTFAHLITRSNVIGGNNVIADPRAAGKLPEEISDDLILESFDLTETLQSYGVCDDKVSHYVSGVAKGSEDKPGERSVILIDFLPTVVSPIV